MLYLVFITFDSLLANFYSILVKDVSYEELITIIIGLNCDLGFDFTEKI